MFSFTWRRAAVLAALVYVGLFLLHFFADGPSGGFQPMYGGELGNQAHAPDAFELSRKNYASSKVAHGFAGATAKLPADVPAAPESQKYEKIGTLSQSTKEFDEDRKRADDLIRANAGMVQHERAFGLKGHRYLQLGVGVPPDKFDGFVEAAKGIGKNVAIEIIKNDKTTEYLQLRAKRQTLEKSRAALEELKSGGGSTEERVMVQTQLTGVEQQIQDLGVSLGEFDSENELCTVKLSLREFKDLLPRPLKARLWQAMNHALADYLMLGFGFFGLMLGWWLGTLALRECLRMWARHGS